MSKDTIRMALGLVVGKRPGGLFVLDRAAVAGALAATRRAYDERGYHTFAYWRNQTEGMAAFGEAMLDALEAADAGLIDELWTGAD
jgi:hypothetical protein